MQRESEIVQFNVKIPISVKYELEEIVLLRKKRGEKATLRNVIEGYVESGIRAEKEKEVTNFSQFVE